MTMLVIKEKGARFTVRAAGICLRDEHVLLQTEARLDFWVLPGGRCDLGETTAHTVAREFHEETGLEVAVGDLLWVMENFYAEGRKAFHEIAFYYRVTLPDSVPPPREQPEFAGQEGETPLLFRWFPVAELERVRLFPTVFRQALHQLPTSPVHLIHHDVDDEAP
ncbi:MAG: NUDIX hydrolase [Thermomicrobiales bacterium]